MSTFRAISLWLLILAIPAQAWAATAMTHCKDVPVQTAESQAAAPHDHSAMMRQMASADSGDHAGHAHHAMANEAVKADQDARTAIGNDGSANALGCDCGCDCSGNCAMTCAPTVLSLSASSANAPFSAVALRPIPVPSQAKPAHRFTPLRPPSAVTT